MRLRSGDAVVEELTAVAAEASRSKPFAGISSEPAKIVTFPVREDIRDAILRAAS